MKRAMFVGRWQPFHNGHKWLIDQKLLAKKSILIAVRDIPPDEANPLTTEQTMHILNVAYENSDVEIIAISDIESVNFGRGVGYEVNEFVPPNNIGRISATQIREGIRTGDQTWKQNVPKAVHTLIQEYLLKVGE